MTDMTAYPYPSAPAAAPQQQDEDVTDSPGPILVLVAGPTPQRRATVAFRLILAIPHLLALYALGAAAGFVLIIGWLGALVNGRLPRFAATYLSGYLRWYARVGGYLLLLTDEYPPFTLDDADFPVRLAVGSGKLNRLTVLFRGILAIPVAIMWLLLSAGLAGTVILIGWPTALIAGRLPAAVHQALAAVLRYNIRYNGYVYLLTGAYPAGLFGDKPGSWGPEAGAYAKDASSRLALSPGAKRLVGVILVVGLLIVAGGGTWAGATISAAIQRDRDISQLHTDVARFNAVVAQHNAAVVRVRQATSLLRKASQTLKSAHDTLLSALDSPAANSDECATVDCFNVTSQPVAEGFAAFGNTLYGIHVPPASAALERRLAASTVSTEQQWVGMTEATSLDDIEREATAAEKTGFDSDYAALSASLDDDLTPLDDQNVALGSAATTLNRQGAALRQRASALNVLISAQTAAGGFGGDPFGRS
jgi:hypothetical protein